jgi:histidine triad (HIT) family protein
MEPNCAFCKIVTGELPGERFIENDSAVAFPSIDPKAPVHLLVVPKEHIASLAAANHQERLLGSLLETVRQVAEKAGIQDSGYKVVINVGKNGGQSIPHLHLHVLGGTDVSGMT